MIGKDSKLILCTPPLLIESHLDHSAPLQHILEISTYKT